MGAEAVGLGASFQDTQSLSPAGIPTPIQRGTKTNRLEGKGPWLQSATCQLCDLGHMTLLSLSFSQLLENAKETMSVDAWNIVDALLRTLVFSSNPPSSRKFTVGGGSCWRGVGGAAFIREKLESLCAQAAGSQRAGGRRGGGEDPPPAL